MIASPHPNAPTMCRTRRNHWKCPKIAFHLCKLQPHDSFHTHHPLCSEPLTLHWCHHVNRNIAMQPSFVIASRIHYHHVESKQFSRPQNISLSLFFSALRLILPRTDSTCSEKNRPRPSWGCFCFLLGHEKSLLIVCKWMTWETTRLCPRFRHGRALIFHSQLKTPFSRSPDPYQKQSSYISGSVHRNKLLRTSSLGAEV